MQKVILIEDDSSLQRVLRIMLERLGFEVDTYEGGRSALEADFSEAPDIVLTDIFMPEVEGMETIRTFRKRFPDSHVIAMSGGVPGIEPHRVLNWARELGANHTLTKPFTPAALWDALESRIG